MKLYIPIVMLAALCLAGCVHKKDDGKGGKKVTKKSKTIKKTESDSIPLLNEADELFTSENDDLSFLDNSDSLFDSDDAISEEINELVAMWEEQEAEKEELTFNTIYFDLNKDHAKEGQDLALEENVNTAKLAVENGRSVVVHGYGCQLGTPEYNIALSQKRASQIKAEMENLGVEADAIQAVGRGQTDAVVTSDSTDRQTLIQELSDNRRIEMAVTDA
ncbi:OmpA family protein [bacterium]|nr:OmpA family protein [bacterium]